MQEYRGEKYWIGTYGVLVHSSLESCLDYGGLNSTYLDPSKRPRITMNGFCISSREQWISKLAFEKDGLLFYKSNPIKYADFIRNEKVGESGIDMIKLKILVAHKEGKRSIYIDNSDNLIIEELEKEWFDIKKLSDISEISW